MATVQSNKPENKATQPATAQPAVKSDAEKPKKTPEEVKAAKEAKFKEVAPPRVRNILKQIEVFTNCSNKQGYEYTPEQVDKIFKTLQEKLDAAKKEFTSAKKTGSIQFEL